ncbi:aromatic acid exporter family protein [Oceanobacillus massiliensis]|uniref:aromatic acid exporter family protein n=1 Tax=Oceanobacillus massiliensis TaxID=1465765 RepID=UPI000289F449|nr:aromatic acid exporter family protein [Oceanobacillus massiliensis]
MRKHNFLGRRVVKTGVAAFFTALICQWIGWPVAFAVITAIVTIEPTVSDSIKKGIIRFPASAIGSAYAVLFMSLFGDSPITYALAAVFTIATCFKLKLHAGLLVATLTSVAMIDVIHGHFLIAFFIRLGTTTIGIGVSTLVNMFVLPPKYRNIITGKVNHIKLRTGAQIEKISRLVLEGSDDKKKLMLDELTKLDEEIHKTEILCRFQREEVKYHPLLESEQLAFQQSQKQLNNLRLIHYHLSNLIYNPIIHLSWTADEKKIILDAVITMANSLKDEALYSSEANMKQMDCITELFWEDNEELTKNNAHHPTNFPPELIVLYELVSIYELVNKFYSEK